MKNKHLLIMLIFGLSLIQTACFTYTIGVGNGPQTGIEHSKMNHYLIYGLAPISIVDPSELAGDAEDYELIIKHTFVDGLISAVTLGIYTPSTTVVRK